MEFRKYQHIERFGTEEVDGIELGLTVVFPKLDGSNGSVWLGDDGKINAGSRNRELTLDDDNQGLCEYVTQHKGIENYLQDHPNHRLYGEWLIPHSFKDYRQDVWRRFWVFDICVEVDDEIEYIPYDLYEKDMEAYQIDHVIPICKIKNGDYESYIKLLQKNVFLVEDGKGVGEGIVIKNYDFYNKYGRQTWAKIVNNEFKEKHIKAMGIAEVETKKMVEEDIVNDYVTQSFVDKEHAKIVNQYGGWQSRYIPELLGRVYSELIKEEMWNIVKSYKMPRVNFKTLNALTIQKIKELKPEIFC